MLRRLFSSAPSRFARPERVQDEVRVLDVRRVTKVTKGGKVLGFTALVVSGNLNGCVGYGYGKALDVPSAVSKAVDQSRRNRIYLEELQTITHSSDAKYCQTTVQLRPARLNSGVRADRNVSAIAQVAGIKDLSAKVHGSNCKLNVVKATFEALGKIESPHDVALRRGVSVYEFRV
jgi:small subunit ribosomal protein S5